MRPIFCLIVATIAVGNASSAALEPIGETIAGIEKAFPADQQLVERGNVVPLWLEDGNQFLYSDNGRSDLSVYLVDPNANTRRQWSIDADVRAAFGVDDDQRNLQWEDFDQRNGLLLIRADEVLYEYDPTKKECRPRQENLLEHAQQISDQFPTTFGPLIEAESPDGKQFVTVQDHDLYLRQNGSETLLPLTTDGHLKETWLNTQESAMSFNVFWSPDSTRIATVQLDAREVWHEPVPHWMATPPHTEPIPYPRSGEPMHRFRPFIIDVASKTRIAIDLGDTANNYVDLLGWRADGREVFVRIVDREHKHLRFYAVDATSGASKLLTEERRDTYIDTPMLLSPKLFHPLGNHASVAFGSAKDAQSGLFAERKTTIKAAGFLYLTEASGWRHIHRYDAEGKLVSKLTGGDWPVHEIVSIDESAGWVYFRASQSDDRPYDLQLYRVSLDGGQPQRLTSGSGVNRVDLSPNGKYFISHRSTTLDPPTVELRHTDGRLIRTLVKVSGDLVAKAGYGGVEPFTARTTDDRWTMHGVIIKPERFDPQAKYPIVEFIYGGMQARQCPHDYFGPLQPLVVRTLLHDGFAVAIVDSPGTPGRGREFQDATYGIWPQTVIANHVKAIRGAAETRPWMDQSRIGIYGHSWGGYMSQRAMIDAPDFYKAAASHAGPSDFDDHPYYIEPFMGLPENNRKGYDAASNLGGVEQIQGPILSMPEPFDVNAGFSPGMKLVKVMMDARKEVELFSTPGSNHRLACCDQNDYFYKVAVITRFLRRHLNNE